MGKRIGESSTTQIRVYKRDRDRINYIISLLQTELKKRITTAEFINMLLNEFERRAKMIERRLEENVG